MELSPSFTVELTAAGTLAVGIRRFDGRRLVFDDTGDLNRGSSSAG
jgi:hypothetical protein